MNQRFERAPLLARVDLAHEGEFALGPVRVYPSRREIQAAGWREVLEPRVMQVLVALARAKGEILSRDDLIESCWEGVVVGEDAINRCIGRLRKAAAASGNAFAIETVARVGYRLRVSEPAGEIAEATSEIAPDNDVVIATETAHPPKTQTAKSRARWLAAAVLVVIAAAFVMWRLWPQAVVTPAAASSVAVLPFANMSGDPAKEYFSDGFSEELLNVLSTDPRLRVAARTSAFSFKGKNDDIQSIARALNVRAVVQGSVREAGNQVRVAAQLIDAANGYSIWSGTYDRNLSNVLSMQDELARAIAAALTHKLLPASPGKHEQRIDPAVYRLYLEGRQELRRQSLESSRKAVVLFQQVTLRQRDFADGFAALSHAAYRLSAADPAHANSHLAVSAEAAQAALGLDPRNIESRITREVLRFAAWDWRGAASDLQALWQQNPNDVQVLTGARIYLNQMGFPEQANAMSRRVIARDPLATTDSLFLIRNLLHGGNYSEAANAARVLLARVPGQPRALAALCASYARTGQTGKARDIEQQLQHVGESVPDNVPSNLEECRFELALAARDLKAAHRMVEGWESQFPDKVRYAVDVAEHYVELGDFARATDWYQRAYARHEAGFFRTVYWPGGARYRATAAWMTLTQQPQFREWQAEHDRIGAELGSHRWPSADRSTVL